MDKAGLCPIGNWCVCQWAFAKYIDMAGGCNSIVNIECKSTNMAALKAYQNQASASASIKRALECLESRCGITSAMEQLYDASGAIKQVSTASVSQRSWILLSLACAAIVLAAYACASQSPFLQKS